MNLAVSSLVEWIEERLTCILFFAKSALLVQICSNSPLKDLQIQIGGEETYYVVIKNK